MAAILFPVFARARENARRTSCVSNLKQLGIGIMMYTQDYDERYPQNTWYLYTLQTDASMPGAKFNVYGGTNDHFRTWMDDIHPYVKSVQLFVCPSARYSTTAEAFPSYGYSDAIGGYSRGSYDGTMGWQIGIPMTGAEIQRVSEIVMLVDMNKEYAHYANPNTMRSYAPYASSRVIVAPHLEGTSVSYADGHAKWVNAAKWSEIGTNNGVRCPASPSASDIATIGYCYRGWNAFLP